jgi:hypothetical protein
MENQPQSNNTNVPISIKQSISFLYYFYHYLFNKRSKDLLVISCMNFILGLLPILIVIFFEINGLDDSKKIQFYGDGSMIIFCFGVLVSFVSFNFPNVIGKISEIEFNNKHNNKLLLFALCFIYYLIAYKLFEKAQLNFSRTWEFIYWINGISFIFIFIAFLLVIFMKYSEEYGYSVINPYREKIITDKMAKKAAKKNKSTKTNIDL